MSPAALDTSGSQEDGRPWSGGHELGRRWSQAQVVIPNNARWEGGGRDMWKRDEAVKPTSGQPATPAPVVSTPLASAPAAPQPESRRIERDMVNIGKSVVIKGELNGSEDLTIEG